MKLKPPTDRRLRVPADMTRLEITKYFAVDIPACKRQARAIQPERRPRPFESADAQMPLTVNVRPEPATIACIEGLLLPYCWVRLPLGRDNFPVSDDMWLRICLYTKHVTDYFVGPTSPMDP